MKKIFLRISNTIHHDLKENIVKVAIVLALLATIYILFENIFVAFVVAIVVSVLLLRWDGRIFFAFGLLFLLFCPFLLAFNQKSTAEDLAVYAYYMLVVGVVMQIFEHGKESFFSKKLIQKEIHNVEKFLNKKKILFISLSVIISTVLLSGFTFYFFYSKIKKELNTEKITFQNLIQQVKLKTEEKRTEFVAEAPVRVKSVDIFNNTTSDWEMVQVSLENNSGQASLSESMIQKFKNLGVFNVRDGVTSTVKNDMSFIEYCSNCGNVAREMLSVLKNFNVINLVEVPELNNQIIVHLGTDQILPNLSDITVSILNGTKVSGKAGILKTEMQKAGFQVQSIGDAATKNYTKTILIFRTGNEEKASLVKNFLSNTYKNIELQENADLSVDVQVILGEISG